MAIVFMDNFSQYGDDETNLLDGLYAEAGAVTLSNDPDGLSGGKVILKGATAFSGTFRYVLPSTQTTVGLAFRIWMANLPTGSNNEWNQICYFWDTAIASHVAIQVNRSGYLRAVYPGGTTETSIPRITAAAWHHLEIKVVCDNASGSVEIRQNGTQVLSVTGVDTQTGTTSTIGNVGFSHDGAGTSDAQMYFKDFIVWDGTGSSNNDFLGDCQVVALLPTSDDSFNWTPSTGTTGYNLIDETTPNDADYISAASAAVASSTFNLSDLDDEVVVVKGLMTVARQLKTDGGAAQSQVNLISGASTDLGADRSITVAATYWTDISELDPATAAAWTPIAVNNVKLEIDRTV